MPRLYFDLETVPNPLYGKEPPAPTKVEPKPVPGNIKDPEKIQARALLNQQKAEQDTKDAYAKVLKDHESHYRSYALYAWKSQVVSVAWAVDDGRIESITGPSERDLLLKFLTAVEHMGPGVQWCAYNALRFDLAVLEARRIYHNIKSVRIPYDAKPWDQMLVADPMTILPFTKDRKSLKAVCSVLQIREPYESGANVYDQFQAGLLKEINKHNCDDVRALREVCIRCGI